METFSGGFLNQFFHIFLQPIDFLDEKVDSYFVYPVFVGSLNRLVKLVDQLRKIFSNQLKIFIGKVLNM